MTSTLTQADAGDSHRHVDGVELTTASHDLVAHAHSRTRTVQVGAVEEGRDVDLEGQRRVEQAHHAPGRSVARPPWQNAGSGPVKLRLFTSSMSPHGTTRGGSFPLARSVSTTLTLDGMRVVKKRSCAA